MEHACICLYPRFHLVFYTRVSVEDSTNRGELTLRVITVHWVDFKLFLEVFYVGDGIDLLDFVRLSFEYIFQEVLDLSVILRGILGTCEAVKFS